MNRIMIVGGAGYIGGYLTDYLNATAKHVLVYDKLVYENRYLKDVPFVFGDISDTNKLGRTIEEWQPDVIVWLAALVGCSALSVVKICGKSFRSAAAARGVGSPSGRWRRSRRLGGRRRRAGRRSRSRGARRGSARARPRPRPPRRRAPT